MAQRTGLTVLLVTAVALTAIDQARKIWVRTSGCRLWRKRPWTGSRSSLALVRRYCRHHRSPTSAMQPAGQHPEGASHPETVTLPLCSRTNASPFWIMLLLVWGRSEHGMIPAASTSLGDSVT